MANMCLTFVTIIVGPCRGHLCTKIYYDCSQHRIRIKILYNIANEGLFNLPKIQKFSLIAHHE